MQLLVEPMPRRCLSISFIAEGAEDFQDGFTVEEWDVCMDDGYPDPDLTIHADNKGIIVPRGTFTIILGDEKLYFKWDGRKLTDVPTGHVYYEREFLINVN